MRISCRLVIGVVALAVMATGAMAFSPAGRAGAQAPSGYQALTPTRILDTRSGVGAQGPLGAGDSIEVTVTGVGGVPASGVGAVVLNVTATNPTDATFVTVWPTGQARPTASNLNVVAGQSVPNLVVATVGAGAKVSLFNYAGSVDLLADVAGWFPAGGSYNPLTPERVLDTRSGLGPPGPVPAGGAINVKVTGTAGVPDSGVGAVVLNVTATNPTDATFVTVWPTGQTRPTASNLNVVAGQSVPNLVIATVGAGGEVSLYNYAGTVDLLADVAGWFPAGADLSGLTPTRILDTRTGLGAPAAKVAAGTHIDLQATGIGGVPAAGVGAVVLNVTATNPTDATFVTAWPTGQTRPTASNLNVVAGQSVPNLVIATVGAGGKVSLYNYSGTTDLIADVIGWFPGTTPPDPADPGTLWAGGNGSIWRYDLANAAAGWVDRGRFGEAFTVDAPRNELVDIDARPTDPVVVTTRDLDTHALHEQFVWPSPAWGVEDITASTDGVYLAAVMQYGSLDTWLEILRRSDRTATDFGFDSLVTEVAFAPNGDLLVVLDDTYEEVVPGWLAAIGRISRAQLDAGSAPELALVKTFGDADGVPSGIRVANDGQISYSRAGALWVIDAPGAVHQLTTGPESQHTGVFSPDGSRIALVLPSIAAGFERQYIIPNHRGTPLYISPSDDAADEYLLDESNLVSSIVAWLP